MKKQLVAGLFSLLGLGVWQAAHAGCQGETLYHQVQEGFQQTWMHLTGKRRDGKPAPVDSILCPEVTAKPPEAETAYPRAKSLPPPPLPDLTGDNDGDGVADGRDWCQTTPQGARVDERGCDVIAETRITLPDRQFESDKDAMNPSLQNALDRLAKRIAATPGREKLMIAGHADSRGKASYNDDLSLRRAWGVADFLSSRGIELEFIDYHGKGEAAPIADNRRRAGRAQNRRVEILVQ